MCIFKFRDICISLYFRLLTVFMPRELDSEEESRPGRGKHHVFHSISFFCVSIFFILIWEHVLLLNKKKKPTKI